MRNEILRHKKIARNKKRRMKRRKSCHEENPDIRNYVLKVLLHPAADTEPGSSERHSKIK